MNLYLVVEGKVGEPKIYEKWVPIVNPNLTYVNHYTKIVNNNFAIISGKGYPNYLNVIKNAITDACNFGNIDRIVIGVDSEDYTYEEKYNEINELINDQMCKIELKIIIQHFCLETWCLANRKIIPRNPQNQILIKYLNTFNALKEDPVLMPGYIPEKLNRAQFAAKYLKLCLNEKNVTYTKSNPTFVANDRFYKNILERYNSTGHIKEFKEFINAFEGNNATTDHKTQDDTPKILVNKQ